MKQLPFLLVILAVTMSTAFGQKVKPPKLPQIENHIKAGEIAEAKDVADRAITYEKTMIEAKAFYLRGLVYVCIDTSSTFNTLADNAMDVAIESFSIADTMNTTDKELYILGENGFPVTISQHIEMYYTHYFNKGAIAYSEENYQGAVDNFAKAIKIFPSDTNFYINAGLAAWSGELFDQAKYYFTKSLEMGVNSKDVYNMLVYIVGTVENNNEGALLIVQKARTLYSDDNELARQEINFMILTDKIEEAKSNLINTIANEPNDPNLHYTLGILYDQLAAKTDSAAQISKADNLQKSRTAYETCLEVDPTYYNCQYNIGVQQIEEANVYIKQKNSLGVSKADLKKASELEPIIQAKLKEALPTWERTVEMKGDDIPSLEILMYLYVQLKMMPKAEAIDARIQALGGKEG